MARNILESRIFIRKIAFLSCILSIPLYGVSCSGEKDSGGKQSKSLGTGTAGANDGKSMEPKTQGSDEESDASDINVNGSLISSKFKVTATVTQIEKIPEEFSKFFPSSGVGSVGKCGPKIFPVKINAAFGSADKGIPLIEISDAKLSCKAMDVIPMDLDLKGILSVFSDSKSVPDLTVESHVIFANRLGDGSYSPPRPFLPSFLASKKEDIAAINMVKDGVRLTSNASGTSVTGKFHLQTIEIKEKDVVEAGTFNDVIHFQTEITGFDSLKIVKLSHFLPNKSAIWISLKPLSIVRIQLEAPATLFVKAAANNPKSIQGIFGTVLGSLKPIIEGNESTLNFADSLTDKFHVVVDLELLEQEGIQQ